ATWLPTLRRTTHGRFTLKFQDSTSTRVMVPDFNWASGLVDLIRTALQTSMSVKTVTTSARMHLGILKATTFHPRRPSNALKLCAEPLHVSMEPNSVAC